jgi:hypothetical protein
VPVEKVEQLTLMPVCRPIMARPALVPSPDGISVRSLSRDFFQRHRSPLTKRDG